MKKSLLSPNWLKGIIVPGISKHKELEAGFDEVSPIPRQNLYLFISVIYIS